MKATAPSPLSQNEVSTHTTAVERQLSFWVHIFKSYFCNGLYVPQFCVHFSGSNCAKKWHFFGALLWPSDSSPYGWICGSCGWRFRVKSDAKDCVWQSFVWHFPGPCERPEWDHPRLQRIFNLANAGGLWAMIKTSMKWSLYSGCGVGFGLVSYLFIFLGQGSTDWWSHWQPEWEGLCYGGVQEELKVYQANQIRVRTSAYLEHVSLTCCVATNVFIVRHSVWEQTVGSGAPELGKPI